MSADTNGGLDPDSPLGRFMESHTCASDGACARDVDEPGKLCASCSVAQYARSAGDDGAALGLGEVTGQGYRVGDGGSGDA